ncbi:MAG: VanZ family protein, partial [Flavobacteriales bacterium]
MRGDLNDTGISREFQFRHAVLPLIWALLILGLHAIPGADLPQETLLGLLHADKAVHLVLFGILSSSVFVALGKAGNIRMYKWYAGFGLIAYGIGLEFAQDLWFEGREASWGDILADGLGVLAGRVAFRG